MARPLRIEYAGAWYHVMNRGAGRKGIFKTDDQRAYFLALLADTHQRFNAEWHAYCLMGNHYHLLVRTPEANLARIMRHVNGLYTQYFNRTERQDGALFRGRYKAILVDAEAYWLQLSRYIHRNPLEAGLVPQLAAYRWSSYRAYIGRVVVPPWLTIEYILRAIGQRQRQARYKAYVAGDTDHALQQFYDQAKIPAILGDEAFKAALLSGRPSSVDLPELRSERVLPALPEVIKATCQQFHVGEQAIWTKTRGKGVKSPARAVAMYLCQHSANMTLSEIADAFGLASYASAGATIRKLRRRIEEDRALAKQIKLIILDLTP